MHEHHLAMVCFSRIRRIREFSRFGSDRQAFRARSSPTLSYSRPFAHTAGGRYSEVILDSQAAERVVIIIHPFVDALEGLLDLSSRGASASINVS